MKVVKKVDRILIVAAVIYIVLPILLFFGGWLKVSLALVSSVAIVFSATRIALGIELDDSVSIAENKRFWLTSLGILAVWVLFSGIGGFSYQTADFAGRNPMFRDLQYYDWPVTYDLSLESKQFRNVVGDLPQTALYVYYFAWWLPAALVGKARGMFGSGTYVYSTENLANIALYIWAVVGVFLTFYCLVRVFKRYSYWILATFMLFSGGDFVMYVFKYGKLPIYEHIEWWAGGVGRYFQYSANTTQLYWVFNQCIPVWLIVSVLLLLKNNGHKAAWSAFSFAYSPYATLGMIPIAIASILEKDEHKLKNRIMTAVSAENIMVPVIMVLNFGLFYLLDMGDKSGFFSGFIFWLQPQFRTFTLYIAFIIVEFGIYLWIMGNKAFGYRFYCVTVAELLVIPLFRGGMLNDFSMRVSIPALFLLMIMCLQFVFDMEKSEKLSYSQGDTVNSSHFCLHKRIMMVALCVGFLTSMTEIQRNVNLTLSQSQDDYINETIYSFGTHENASEDQIALNIKQYMALDKDYIWTFYYKYMMN